MNNNSNSISNLNQSSLWQLPFPSFLPSSSLLFHLPSPKALSNHSFKSLFPLPFASAFSHSSPTLEVCVCAFKLGILIPPYALLPQLEFSSTHKAMNKKVGRFYMSNLPHHVQLVHIYLVLRMETPQGLDTSQSSMHIMTVLYK